LSGHKNIRGWVYGSTVGQWIHEGGGHTVLEKKIPFSLLLRVVLVD